MPQATVSQSSKIRELEKENAELKKQLASFQNSNTQHNVTENDKSAAVECDFEASCNEVKIYVGNLKNGRRRQGSTLRD